MIQSSSSSSSSLSSSSNNVTFVPVYIPISLNNGKLPSSSEFMASLNQSWVQQLLLAQVASLQDVAPVCQTSLEDETQWRFESPESEEREEPEQVLSLSEEKDRNETSLSLSFPENLSSSSAEEMSWEMHGDESVASLLAVIASATWSITQGIKQKHLLKRKKNETEKPSWVYFSRRVRQESASAFAPTATSSAAVVARVVEVVGNETSRFGGPAGIPPRVPGASASGSSCASPSSPSSPSSLWTTWQCCDHQWCFDRPSSFRTSEEFNCRNRKTVLCTEIPLDILITIIRGSLAILNFAALLLTVSLSLPLSLSSSLVSLRA